MKWLGTITTTTVEAMEVDIPDGIPQGEMGELFAKLAMTLSTRVMLGKSVQYNLLSTITPPPMGE